MVIVESRAVASDILFLLNIELWFEIFLFVSAQYWIGQMLGSFFNRELATNRFISLIMRIPNSDAPKGPPLIGDAV